jgi:hypothetical protein
MYLNRRATARQQSETGVPSAVVLGNPVFDRDPLPEPDYPQKGVLLVKVAPGSSAAKAGLARGDVLLKYGGKELASADSLGPAIAAVNEAVQSGQREPDEPVEVTYWRDGKTVEASLSPGRMGVQPSRGNPADGLRSMARVVRGFEQGAAEVNATDQVRLFGGRLDSLPGTAREATAIARIVGSAGGDATLLTGEEATIAKLNQAVAGKRFVHLATHGLTGDSERPYDASLALTQPKQVAPADIGFLRLEDLITTWRGKLRDCELVVLSACDTQRGAHRGTGIMSLPWGFMYAGVPTVVASLWKVDDTATMLLMTRFYENLLGVHDDTRGSGDHRYAPRQRMPKAEALREAKQWLRSATGLEIRKLLGIESDADWQEFLSGIRGIKDVRETVEEATPSVLAETRPFEHPYYWAAFILIGDPD